MNNDINNIEFIKLLEDFISKDQKVKLRKILNKTLAENQHLYKTESSDENINISFRIILDIALYQLKQWLDNEKYLEAILSLIKYFIVSGYYNFASNLNNLLFQNFKKNSKFSNYYGYGLLSIAEIYVRQALWNDGIKNLNAAKRLFIYSKDNEGIARCYNLSGRIFAEQGNIKRAQSHFQKGLDSAGNKTSLIVGLINNNIGINNCIAGHIEQARSFFSRALLVFEKLNKWNYIADVRQNLGMIYVRKGFAKDALKEFDRAIKIAEKIGYKNILAIAYQSKGYLFCETEDLTLADYWVNKSLKIAIHINDNLTIADCYKVKGIIARKNKDYPTAEKYLLESIRLNEDFNNELNYAESCFEIGLLFKERCDSEGANLYFNKALGYYKKINSSIDIKKIKSYL